MGNDNLKEETANNESFKSLMFDWNTLNLEQMVEHLRRKFMFSSSGDAKCINTLIDFYDKNK